MKVGYVALYVNDPVGSLSFWTDRVGLVLKSFQEAGGFKVNQVGFSK
ncbi:hypothetical protein [Leptospira ognonensis]|nr:hypothetical protein [Leptospira ognonensis]